MTVYPSLNSYLVVDGDVVTVIVEGSDGKPYCVACHSGKCDHINAVAHYIKEGGAQAYSKPVLMSSKSADVVECPVCGSPVSFPHGNSWAWECPNGHNYFTYRGAQVAGMMAGRKTGIPAIDSLSADEYDRWLASLAPAQAW